MINVNLKIFNTTTWHSHPPDGATVEINKLSFSNIFNTRVFGNHASGL